MASKLTDTTSEIICQHVRQNMVPPPVAAQSIGVTYRTFQTWMKSGASDDWTGKNTRHARFYRSGTRARCLKLACCNPGIR
jgi:hypothetical protein